MANFSKRLVSNIEGNFFVDSTCIDCDTCRQLAPTTFVEDGNYSTVFHQPENKTEESEAYQALIACPVGSIGVLEHNDFEFTKAKASFPMELETGVLYNGFNSEKSFGANSYFVEHPEGNWLIDSPRYVKHLVDAFKERGGIRYIFLSHEDDVADASRYAKVFEATRIIHREDLRALPEAEWVVEGEDVVQVGPEFSFIPVPGHTQGSLALLYNNRFLFSGDHLWWDPIRGQLDAPSVLIWDKEKLMESLTRLLDVPFEWVLPGHGHRAYFEAKTMRGYVKALVELRA
ncbi:MBL fold metallo-hydrolase [Candidatus Nitronereus thalassa]|uniref:MBL fold metallo-hydrolase n=1 Tax=Candidatus Nitronereus thalassa TaxID=3020898 RepID=A0ABU3K9T5_9BACT|nr:MBL fold metallo-hydrolase [Candidatus Nitronereus thalassa]MDT7043155.1 MBL fold metallo-hydrolase [Candidatus Nitronereus thalassa]